MAKLNTLHHNPAHRICVYGEPKSGKTQLCGELAKTFNLIWFDLENGFETLFKLPPTAQERIDLIRIPDTKVYPIAIETMLKVISGNPVDICIEHGKVSCPVCKKENKEFNHVDFSSIQNDPNTIVVIDSLTQLSNSAMNFLTKGKDETYKPEWGDYSAQGHLMDKFLSQVQQSPFNIICITHITETTLEDGKKKLVPVSGTTTFSRNTAKYFDHVIYCEIKNKAHAFSSSTTASNLILTGSRTDFKIEEEKLQSLVGIFSEGRDKKSEGLEKKVVGNLGKYLGEKK